MALSTRRIAWRIAIAVTATVTVTAAGTVTATAAGTVLATGHAPAAALTIAAGTVTPIDPQAADGATAVLANIAMVDGAAPGYITADRCSTLTAGPQARANGNHLAATAIANLSVTPLDTDGRLCIYNQSPVNLVVDVQGTFGPAAEGGQQFARDDPYRALDTRQLSTGRPAAGAVTRVDTEAAGSSAVLANIAMVEGAAAGYITADRCSTLIAGPQARANGNHLAATAIANLSVVPLDPDGTFCVYNQASVHLVVDIQGSFATAPPAGSGFEPATATRVHDSRTGNAALVAAASITRVDTSAAGAAGADAVLANIAMVDGAAPGYVTADRCSALTPGPQQRANGNHLAATAIANLSVVPLDPDGSFCIYNQSAVHLIVDVQGTFAPTGSQQFFLATPTRVLDTRPPPGSVPTGPPHTSCAQVVHIGDSTSVGMISPTYLPDPADRLPAQYVRVGVVVPRMEISGARSIVETLSGQMNARDVAAGLKAAGYSGCWAFALGTTDAANIAVAGGQALSRQARIDRMMAVVAGDPVLWVTVKTRVGDGSWSNVNMALWNQALWEATSRHPNLRVYDWAAVVQNEWFAGDGIHYTTDGYRWRARLIADALAVSYPAG